MCLTIQVRLVIKMKTIVAKADLENEELFRKASDILKSGGLELNPIYWLHFQQKPYMD